jgi:hypothetical protein
LRQTDNTGTSLLISKNNVEVEGEIVAGNSA